MRYSTSPIGGSTPPVHAMFTLKPTPAPDPTCRQQDKQGQSNNHHHVSLAILFVNSAVFAFLSVSLCVFEPPAVCLPVHHQLISLCILVAFSVIGLLHPAIRSFLSCDHICHLNSNSHRFSLICLLFVPVHYIMQVEIFLASLVSQG